MREIFFVNRIISVQFRVFITSQIQWRFNSFHPRFHPSLNASPTLEILFMTDIALKAEQVSSTIAANFYYLSTDGIRKTEVFAAGQCCNRHLRVNRLITWLSTVIFLQIWQILELDCKWYKHCNWIYTKIGSRNCWSWSCYNIHTWTHAAMAATLIESKTMLRLQSCILDTI